jgi:hypothetical protein
VQDRVGFGLRLLEGTSWWDGASALMFMLMFIQANANTRNVWIVVRYSGPNWSWLVAGQVLQRALGPPLIAGAGAGAVVGVD